VGDSEAEGFWRQFLGSLKKRGLDGTRQRCQELPWNIRLIAAGCTSCATC
jgi:hypothetical protein